MTGDALLAAVWDRPHDDLPRLAYADWLDDLGAPEQAARAEFIRVQCELARLGEWDDACGPLRRREAALLRAWGRVWRAGLPQPWTGGFDRGFPACRPRTLPVGTFLKLGDAALSLCPLYDLTLPAAPTQLDRLLACPQLRRVGRLGFDWWLTTAAAAARFVASPHVRNVAALSVAGVAGDALVALAEGTDGLPHLAELSAWAGGGDAGLRAVLRSPLVGRLRALDLSDANVSAAGLAELFTSPRPAALERFAWPFVPGWELTALTASRPAFRLRALELPPLTGAVTLRWAEWVGLGSVRRLTVTTQNRAGTTALARLARSPHLADLRHLRLRARGSAADVAAALATLTDPAALPGLTDLWLPVRREEERRNPVLGRLRERFGRRLRYG